MTDCLMIVLSNAVLATGIAILAITVARWGKRPHLAHALWLLVFLKLITPPLVPLNVLDSDPIVEPQGRTTEGTPLGVLATQDKTTDYLQIGTWFETDGRSADHSRLSERLAFPGEQRTEHNQDIQDLHETPSAAKATRTEGSVGQALARVDTDQASSIPSDNPGFRRHAASAASFVLQRTSLKWISRGLVFVWLVGAFALFMRSFLRLRDFGRLVDEAAPADAKLRQFVEELSTRVGLKRVPTVRVVSGNLSPMVFSGSWRNYLIIPRDLVNWLGDKRQFETLIAHELAHLRRLDHWVRRLELFVTCLFWWLPTVWLAKRGIREAEEEICDAWVIAMLPQAHRTYAEALLNTADFLHAGKVVMPPMTSAISHFRFIKRRIVMIMHGSVPTRLAWSSRIFVWLLGVACLPLSFGFAQSSEPETDFPPVEGVIAAKKAEIQEKLVRQIIKQDDEAIDEDEIEEILAEIREELTSELGELDDEIREAMEEVREELQDELGEVPAEVKAVLSELNIADMLDEALADAPKPVKNFVKSLQIEEAIEEALEDFDVDEIEIDKELFQEIQAELEQELGQELKREMANMSRELKQARREVKEAMRGLPPEARAALKQLDLEELLKESLQDTNPIVKEIVDEIGVIEIIEAAAEGEDFDHDDADEDEGDEDEEVEEGDNDDLSDIEEKLERRLEALMEEVDEIRRELRRVKRMRR